MYDYIKGNVAELSPTYVVLDNHGVGYMINISLNSFNALQHQEDVVKVYVYEAIREDAHLLYGFTERRERELFLLLISVSGVGANTARMILSSLTPSDLEQTIASENVGILKSVKGIGAKTAERIIVDLKDKIKLSTDTLLDKSQVTSEVFDEAMSALVMLGFTKQMSQKALKKLFTAEPTITVEQAIKKALKMM
ncbi:MAG: Holliday junction branch migration protein RuvA [Bacteroidales bacterium]|nr:Holliday junction branch migration protein RuvA [Bacteroidales bacterium]MDD7053422.1 Holliday junction branch migration protein RuvA [Bacteroidales bacterium]MDY5226605.1 Holliday junction branch migration protein RuvA [Sodaliphilus sp.]